MVSIYYTRFEAENDAKAKRQLEHRLGLELLKTGLMELYGLEISVSDSAIGRGRHGKPYLIGHPEIHFNISHCEGLAVCGFCETELGLDVEYIQPYRENVVRKVLSEREKEAFGKMAVEEKAEYFFRLWTLKESYVKAVGCGITVPLSEIEFCLDPAGKIDCPIPGVGFWQKKIDSGRILSVCVAEGNVEENSVVLEELQLMECQDKKSGGE